MYDLIVKKRDGGTHSAAEIRWMVEGFTAGDIPDYQMAAWCMAVYFNGMTADETTQLTTAMVESGDRLDLSAVRGVKVDKHSTGGVGDKTTLVLGPLVAACGVPVAKMSGRALGHTGGTLDKLESIPGLSVDLSPATFIDQVNDIGLAVAGQTARLAPADKKLYSLRDVTGTVDILPLIAASIMSKKLAAGADALVLDVKVGSGSFLPDKEAAAALAHQMVGLGAAAGRRTVALLTAMQQPLGFAIGNALEVKEAIQTLRGEGPADLMEVVVALGSEMLCLAGVAGDRDEAGGRLYEALQSGAGLAKFRQFVQRQGGDPSVIEDLDRLPAADHVVSVNSPGEGYITRMETKRIGGIAVSIGAGRQTKTSVINPAVGIFVRRKVGEAVRKGDVVAEIHAADIQQGQEAAQALARCYELSDQPPTDLATVLGRIDSAQ